MKRAIVFVAVLLCASMASAAVPLPYSSGFESDALGSAAGWESGYPSLVNDAQPAVSAAAASPAGGGLQGLDWVKNNDGSARSGVSLRWNALPSSTTGVLDVSYDFKIAQQSSRALSFVISGWDAANKVNLNVFNLRFDSDAADIAPGWNYLDNGNWNTFIPISDASQVVGHWFHYDAKLDAATHLVDLTITALDAGGAGGHIVGTFQGGNPLDADMANWHGIDIFQSTPNATSEVLIDNVSVSIVPEPVSLALAVTGLLALATRRRS